MVNIHIVGDKTFFQSKNAIARLKTKIRELGDPQLIVSNEFLKENYEFNFKEEKDDIFVNIQETNYLWGDMGTKNKSTPEIKQVDNKEDGKEKLRAKLRELKNKRAGVHVREMNTIKKSVDKSIFKKYSILKQMIPNFPIPKPTDLLDDPEKHKQEIQMFSSGMIQLTQNPQLDGLLSEYFREISEKVGYPILSKDEVDKMMEQNMPEQQKPTDSVPASINLNSYVDSDTESEDDSEVSDVEMKIEPATEIEPESVTEIEPESVTEIEPESVTEIEPESVTEIEPSAGV